MKLPARILITLLFAACSTGAFAQRRAIPVAELVDVPVVLATPKPQTIEQVRRAIIAAAVGSDWEIDPLLDGSSFKLVYLRDFESRIELTCSYTASTYSLRYVSSENLAYSPSGEIRSNMSPPIDAYLKDYRATRAARQPEFRYAVDRQGPFIHPAYEAYLYEFSASIRRHLRWATE